MRACVNLRSERPARPPPQPLHPELVEGSHFLVLGTEREEGQSFDKLRMDGCNVSGLGRRMQRAHPPLRPGPAFGLALGLALLAACSGGSHRFDDHPATRTIALPSAAERRQCLAQLSQASARFTPLPDRIIGGGCAIVGAVRLDSLNSDTAMLGLGNLGPVACPLANAFAAWARYGVDRAAKQLLGSPLVRIETMGSYACRNIAGSERRSAHATANAIDVSGFVLADGRRISVLRDWSGGSEATRNFLRVIHESACKRFGTTLGPDYNAAHNNHLHLEYTGGRFCR